MKKGALALLFVAAIAVPVSANGQPAEPAERATGEILVRFKKDVPSNSRRDIRSRSGVDTYRGVGRIQLEKWELEDGIDPGAVLERLRTNPNVLYAEPNWKVRHLGRSLPDDPFFDLQWHLDASPLSVVQVGSWLYTVDPDMDGPEGWFLFGAAYGEPGIGAVGILDSGCGTSGFMDSTAGYVPYHEDLPSSQLFYNSVEIIDGVDNDGNGYVDDMNGWDWVEQDNVPADSDPADHNHGTFLSGLVSARWGNGTGTAGAGRNVVGVLPLRASYVDELVSAIGYAANLADSGEPVRVLNASWMVPWGPVQALEDAIADAGSSGILFVASAGNESSDNDGLSPVYPASYSTRLANVLSVAATDRTGDLAGSSNYGLNSVQIAAPGESIISTWSGFDGYETSSGTSLSAPLVCSAAAMVFAIHPALATSEAMMRLQAGGDFDERLSDRIASSRRISLAGALAPFYPFSGLVYLGASQQLTIYSDPDSASFGSITGGASSHADVAVLSGDAAEGWAVSPVGPGITAFTLDFANASHAVTSLETGPWRVTAVEPFTGVLEANQYVDFTSFADLAVPDEWDLEILEGTDVGHVNPDSGFFVALNPGRFRVVLSRDGQVYDHSGPWRVFPTANLQPSVVITSVPGQGVIGSSATFSWSGEDQDGWIQGYFVSLDAPTDPDTWTTATTRTETGITGGNHSFYVRAVDDKQAVSEVAYCDFTIGPPTVTILEGPVGPVSGDEVTFSWAGSDEDGSVAGYYYSLDNPLPSIWTTDTTVTLTGLTEGSHTFYLVGEDDLGGRSEVISWPFEVTRPGNGDSGRACFLTTVAAGTSMAADLPRLRVFRDRYLTGSAPGRTLVRAYYSLSPGLSASMETRDDLKTLARTLMMPVTKGILSWMDERERSR